MLPIRPLLLLFGALLLLEGAAFAQAPGPLLKAPNDGSCAPFDGPLVWTAVPGATSYEIRVIPSPLTTYTTSETNIVIPGLATGVTHTWSVRATDNQGIQTLWSEEFSFVAIVSLGSPAALVSPAENAACVALQPTLDWTNVAGAVQYEVRIDSAGLVFQTSASNLSVPAPLPNDTVQSWRVRAVDDCGRQGDWAGPFVFTVQGAPSDPPTLVSPPTGTGCLGTSVFLDWEEFPGAVQYRIYLGPSGSAPPFSFTTAASELTPPGLAANASYVWQVEAVTDCGWLSPRSELRSFTTHPPLGALAQAVSPAPDAPCESTSLELDWSDVPGAIQYHVAWGPEGSTFETLVTSQSQVPISAFPSTVHEWTVQAVDNCGNLGAVAGPFVFRTTPNSIAIPTPAGPLNGDLCVVAPVLIQWGAVDFAAQYEVQLTPSNQTYVTSDTELTLVDFVPGPLYGWKVRTVDQCGLQSDWSVLQRFQLDGLEPTNPPVLASQPQLPNVWSNEPSLAISWDPGADNCAVLGYSLEFDTSPNTLPDEDIETKQLTFVGPTLADGQNHWVHLRAVDEAGLGAKSAVHLGPFWIDTVDPLATLHQPAGNISAMAGSTFRFEWTAADALSGVGSVQIRMSSDGGVSFPTLVASPNPTATVFDWEVPDTVGAELVFRLLVSDAAGNLRSMDSLGVMTIVDTTTDAPEPLVSTRLVGNAPNPFNPRTMIEFELSRPSNVWLEIFDLRGRRVRQLVAGDSFEAGRHSAQWNATDDQGRTLASATYLVRLRAGNREDQLRVVLVR